MNHEWVTTHDDVNEPYPWVNTRWCQWAVSSWRTWTTPWHTNRHMTNEWDMTHTWQINETWYLKSHATRDSKKERCKGVCLCICVSSQGVARHTCAHKHMLTGRGEKFEVVVVCPWQKLFVLYIYSINVHIINTYIYICIRSRFCLCAHSRNFLSYIHI